ncbi:MRM2 [Candida jiufengensis]|uniref:MRM2 n=1 Tax=Candida jiufengensis TaxID=497108 RepID=UPI0022247C06|nr:MRM2 [Candida jiufengensis]KAI5956943.1 MRM2 [Candida jiufengensis]
MFITSISTVLRIRHPHQSLIFPLRNLFRQFSIALTKSSPHSSHYKTFPKLKKITRAEEAELQKIESQKKFQFLDNKYDIIDYKTKKILDIGFAPGNWLNYVVEKLIKINHVKDYKLFSKNIYVLGFDILFKNPPLGTSSIQGNIFSKLSSNNIINHFKNIELNSQKYKLINQSSEELIQKSYFEQEQETSSEEKEDDIIHQLTENLDNLKLNSKKIDWKIDLVISDLSKPGKQQSGYYDHTETNPYLRYNNNKGLNHSIMNPEKGNIDLADASILLMSKILKPGGKFILKLSEINNDDTEIVLMEERLKKMFNEVYVTNLMKECIFVCLDRKK